MPQQEVCFSHIQDALKKLSSVILRTPTVQSTWLSHKAEASVFLKLENLQVTGSFKPRGAYIKMVQLTTEERRLGVVAMSAGNHAQGVAFHAKNLGIPATIIMPVNTPFAKIERTEAYGVTVLCQGETLSDSEDVAVCLSNNKNMTLIHPYDDPAIIAGQGTIALEMLQDVPDLDVLILPVGGGGMASGISLAAKNINPMIKIYGVQSAYCPEMIKKIYPQRWFMPPESRSSPLAEGIAVKKPGDLTTKILQHYLTDMLVVSEEEIEQAIYDLMTQGKLVVEGAGAVGVAALLQNFDLFAGKKVGLVIGGGNIDSRLLSSLLLRGLVRQRRLIRLKIQVQDAPGNLSRCAAIIGESGGNIFEINHQRLFNSITVKMTDIDTVIETHGQAHSENIVKKLQENGFPTRFIE